jgi:hypothetical protein
MRKLLLGLVVLVALGAGTYYYLKKGTTEDLKVATDRSLEHLPVDVQVTYDSLDLAPAMRSATIRGLVVHYRPEPDFELKAAEVTVINPSLSFADGWNQAVAKPGDLTPETVLPLADAVSAKDIRFKGAAQSGAIGLMRFEGLRVYPWSLTRPDTPSFDAIASMIKALPPQPKPDDLMPLLRVLAGFGLSSGYDKVDGENISITVVTPATPQMPSMPVTESVARIHGSGVERGIARGISESDIEVKMGAMGSSKVESVSFDGFDARDALTRLVSGDKPDPSMLDKIVVGKMAMANLTVQSPIGPSVTLGGFAISDVGFGHGMPVSAAISLTSLHLAKDQMPDQNSKQVFDDLGIDAATVSFAAAYRWDIDKKHVSLHDTALKVDELGAVDLAVDGEDIDQSADVQSKAKLSHAILHYQDNSLVKRAIAYQAKSSGVDPAALRKQLIDGVRESAAMFGGSPIAAEAVTQIVAFLNAPKSLTVELAPKQPVDLATLEAAGGMPNADTLNALGVSVVANK